MTAPTPDQAARIEAALGEGERVLWSECPRASDEVRVDLTIWGLPLVWAAVMAVITAVALIASAHGHGAGSSILPVMLPLWLIGVWLLAAPWVARAKAAHAVYALSDRRWMRFDRAALPTKSIALGDVGPIESDEGADGYGTLHLRLRAAATGQGRSIVYWRCRGLPNVVELRRLIAVRL